MSKLLDSVGLAEFGKQFLARLNNIFVSKEASENFTTAEKTKLSGIATGAEVNVQSDWSVSDSSSDAYIAHKPTIPTKTSDLTNDSGFIGTAEEQTISAALNDLNSNKQDTLTFDSTPTSNSTNPVTSGGVYTALSDMATLASPAFTGTPTSTTPTAGDDSTKIATTAFVNDAIDTAIADAGIPSSSTITGIQTRLTGVENALNAVSGAYVYKGSVATYANLPSQNLSAGDVYNVIAAYGDTPAGTNYAWVEESSQGANDAHWDPLGGSFTIQAMDNSDISDAIDEIFDEE